MPLCTTPGFILINSVTFSAGRDIPGRGLGNPFSVVKSDLEVNFGFMSFCKPNLTPRSEKENWEYI